MKKGFKIQGQDIALAFFVLSIASMLVMPLPTPLLDFLLVVNISFSLLLLLVGLYMPNALALFAFPSLLLLTTLFRLGLNVASTRLILSQGDAGFVIQAFGSFLIRGEIAVGIIIFLIITVVNFIVIAKGASRVSEVAARFALDSLPGKQMAIDSDLRAGLIDAMQARKKRDDLRKESQLYGAMDGAMKFIQGDAIAGLFITFTNIIGGMYIGMREGMGISEAIETYSILTVGDGLVSQVPALLISICAGIVVTRVSSGENTTLGRDLSMQLFKNPGIIMFTSGILFFFAFLPALPAWPFIIIGLGFLSLSLGIIYQKNKIKKKAEFLPISTQKEQSELLGDDINENETFLIYIDKDFGNYVNEKTSGILKKCSDYKEAFHDMTGFELPSFKFIIKKEITKDNFVICKLNTPVFESNFSTDIVCANINKSFLKVLGLESTGVELSHPLYGNKLQCIKKDNYVKLICKEADIQLFDKIDWVMMSLVSFCLKNPSEFISLYDITKSLKEIEKDYPEIVKDIFKFPQISNAKIYQVFIELLKENVFYISHKQILENIISYFNSFNISANSDFDVFSIVAFIRQNKKIYISNQSLFRGRRIKLCSIDETLSLDFEENVPNLYEGNIQYDAKELEGMKNNLNMVLKPFYEKGIGDFAIVTTKELVPVVYSVLSMMRVKLQVLSFDELSSDFKIEHVGVWRK